MKKGYALIALILTIFFPVKVFALTATVNMTCDDHGLPDVGTVSCTIAASSDDVVTGFHGVLSFSDDVSIQVLLLGIRIELKEWSVAHEFGELFCDFCHSCEVFCFVCFLMQRY